MKKLKRILKTNYVSLCDVCIRNEGYNPKNDDLWLCKYGCHELGDLSVKCKYFKRDSRYHTCNGLCKNKKTWSKNKPKTIIQYRRGKFYSRLENK